MQRFGIGGQEMKMAKLLWDREGIGSGAVVKLCKEELNWAKSTTYTMLRRLCEHGLFQNVNSIVTPVISEEEYESKIATDLVDDKFGGSLQNFVTLYLKQIYLSKIQTPLDNCLVVFVLLSGIIEAEKVRKEGLHALCDWRCSWLL